MVLVLAARSSIPMGYMLDAAALHSGSIRLALCSFGATLPHSQRTPTESAPQQAHHSSSPLHAVGEASPHHAGHAIAPEASLPPPAEHGDNAHDQACPFGLMMAQGLAAPPADGVIALTLPSLARTILPGLAPEALPPLPPLGPPLGSRAPPDYLA